MVLFWLNQCYIIYSTTQIIAYNKGEHQMNITIIGSGNMTKAIATRFLGGNHNVTVHAKDVIKGQALVDDLSKNGGEITVQPIGNVIKDEVVILAVPYTEISNIATQYDNFAGKIVVDITNPLDFTTFQLIPAAGTSGAEEIAKLLPSAKVVKGFNSAFAATLIAGEVDGQKLDIFIAGDDAVSKQVVGEMIETSGMRVVDAGPLSHARHLEGLALIHIMVQDQLKTGWMSAIKIIG